MATYKGVYFSDRCPDKWFETREEAEEFDLQFDLIEVLAKVGDLGYQRMAKAILDNYTIYKKEKE